MTFLLMLPLMLSFLLVQAETYPFTYNLGSAGSGNSQFSDPYGIVIDDSNGFFYVADTYNSRIQKFNSAGIYQTQWGSQGSGNDQLNRPFGVAVYGSEVYVADTYNHRIQVFSITGVPLRRWGSFGSGNDQLNYPTGIAVDSTGVYVADWGNNRVQVFSLTGTPLRRWGTFGSGNDQLNYPYGVALDSSHNVYAADTGNHRVQVFSLTGTPLRRWGTFGSGNDQLNSPQGVALDSYNNVYVADTSNHRIVKYTSFGTYLTNWGSQGSGDGQLNFPSGVTVYGSSFVYVADRANDRIATFSRIALAECEPQVEYAEPNTVYFIYADPNRMTRAVATYDVAAGAIIYGACDHTQIQRFDNDPTIMSQNDPDRGRLLFAGNTVLMFGSRNPCYGVRYLEDKRLTPIYFVNDGSNVKMIETATGVAKVNRAISSMDWDHEDYFVLMVCMDENDNRVFINYGFEWKGTWATGIYLKAYYSTVGSASSGYYIFHWVDSDGNGIPQANECSIVAWGS